MKPKGYSYHVTRDDLIAYSRLPAKDKLIWLEEANRFTAKALKGRRRKIWEMFRRGEI